MPSLAAFSRLDRACVHDCILLLVQLTMAPIVEMPKLFVSMIAISMYYFHPSIASILGQQSDHLLLQLMRRFDFAESKHSIGAILALNSSLSNITQLMVSNATN